MIFVAIRTLKSTAMPTDKKHLQRLQLLDQCLSDPHTEYTFEELMHRCKISRATLFRELQTIVRKFGSDVFTNQKRGKKRIYRYRLAGFSIVPNEVTSTQLAQIKSILLLLNKFVGKPQFEFLQSIIRGLERRYHIELPNTEAFIHFDGNIYVKGLEHLVPLFDAVINKQCVQITYQPFDGPKRVFIAHAYLLKEYNQRWYVLCNSHEDIDEPLKLRTLALDRMEHIEVLKLPFVEAPEQVDGYFDDVIGITKKEDKFHDSQDIIIKCDPMEFKYILTKPIHPSQRPIKDKPNHIKIKVKENYELYQWLLFYGDKIEIVSPLAIRNEFRQILRRMTTMYKE
jgi:predicted DNA-binding transcriptional regulator YafY